MSSTKCISSTEKLAVVLSLPRGTKHHVLPKVKRPIGLPINALPGWEDIPLHSKLPMLKCPNNEVIFSKSKIGENFETRQRDFDTVCRHSKMDYNSLLDPHLRRFYSNEKLLKRLRDNGEITENNDVICTLKEFNEYRIPLHETYLKLIHVERNRLHDEMNDMQMIAHAEAIAEWDKQLKGSRRKGMQNRGNIFERKSKLNKQHAQRIQVLRESGQRKFQQIEAMKDFQKIVSENRKKSHDSRIKHCLGVGLVIEQKRLNALNKHLQFKSDRSRNYMQFIKENANKQVKLNAQQWWDKHLKERIEKREQVKRIIKENERDMNQWTANHMAKYQKKWQKIQTELNKHHRRQPKMRPRRKHPVKRIHRALEKSNDDTLRSLKSEDIHNALETALGMKNNDNVDVHNAEDSIYKSGKLTLERILANFNKNLCGDKHAENALAKRIFRLFIDVKQYVIKRASQIIATGSDTDRNRFSTMSTPTNKHSLSKFVSFNSFAALIGKGSYGLDHGDVKMSVTRTPTPASSLTSVVIEPEDNNDDNLRNPRPSLHQMTRDERIFIEHLFIKFKRQLIVGIGRQVLAAIECHRKNKILAIRTELQDIDKQFLVKIMTRSILSYALNSCNFHSNILLCQHALAGDIILALQKTLLNPARDPRVIVQPRSRCVCAVAPPFSTHCNLILTGISDEIVKYLKNFTEI